MKRALLTIITENQHSIEEAQNLSKIIQTVLGKDYIINKIEPYHKFEHSYSIHFENNSGKNDIQHGIATTDKIASPWLVYFDDEQYSIELIFNKQSSSQFKNPGFEAILWGHWQTAHSL